MIDFYHFHDQLWWWKTFRVVMYYIDVPWFIPGAEERKLEILMSSHLCTECYHISCFQILICVYFSSFSFTPESEKRWSKPARLASFKILCPCREKMLTDFALMPAREAGADEDLWQCGQNSEWLWKIAAVANAELASP